MFFTCINCIIQYFLSECLIKNPCFRNFGDPLFPPLFSLVFLAAGNLKMPIHFVLREVPQPTTAQFTSGTLI